MPFYTFETQDDVEDKVFLVRMTFAEYDAVMDEASQLNSVWHEGENGPIHPKTEQRVKNWCRRIDLDEVHWNSTMPWETSKWDNFEYRAGYNMVKAQQSRRTAETRSHMGMTPIQDQEKALMGDRSFDLGSYDMNNHEGDPV